MIEVNYQIVNEAIKRFCENYPDGGDWGDMMHDYHNIELYLEHKEDLLKKVQAEHELEMDVHRSNIKFNKWQKVATTICVICTIINLGVVLYQLIK